MMNIEIRKGGIPDGTCSAVFLINQGCHIEELPFLTKEKKYIKKCITAKESGIFINHVDTWSYLCVKDDAQFVPEQLESFRVLGTEISEIIFRTKSRCLEVIDWCNSGDLILSVIEGIALSGYRFLKYRKAKETLRFPLERINLISSEVTSEQIDQLNNVLQGVYITRDLVNEPASFLTAVKLGEYAQELGRQSGCKVHVLNESEIKALEMEGLLAVNQGSVDPPSFIIMEWKPPKCRNRRPVVLVGKGVTFDTGGINLKTQSSWIEPMKSDMSGAAAVLAVLYSLAISNEPIWVVGLVPATDNRPSRKAQVPGDIIFMSNGTTVEVTNTDAEGRLILADALLYAAEYKPSLVIDIATLTGSAANAIGNKAMVGMHKGAEDYFRSLQKSGVMVHERIVEFPIWAEYLDLLKSDVADIKNVGGREAGAITAAKFLEYFVSGYPWIHLDIAGPAYIESNDKYRVKGGTGVGVRLLFNFLKGYK